MEIYSNKNTCFHNELNPKLLDIDKIEVFETSLIENIVLNPNKDNTDELLKCVVCTEYEI